MDGILNFLKLLHDDSDIVEIRSIDPKPTISGYFRADSQNIMKELARFPGRTFYQTMNQIDCGCYARAQHEKLMPYPKETTSDRDIIGYRWILIDCDPVRPSGVSSTDAEKQEARRTAALVRKHLMERGFCEPVVADSGNGYHLLFRVKALLDRKDTIADFLKVLDMWFSSDAVQIDTAVYNPARITKLYGTMATKGSNTQDRPHRQSRIVLIPEKLEITPFELVEAVAAEKSRMIPTAPQNTRRNEGPFDMDSFLASHNIGVARKLSSGGFTKYILTECPFDPNHKAPDAAVFVGNDGRLGFKCFHNSCSDYSWHDFRSKVDPDAYSTSAFAPNALVDFRRLPVGIVRESSAECQLPEAIPFDQAPPSPPAVQQPAVPAEPAMLDIADIEDYDRSKIVVIKSRLGKLDSLIGGFNKGELSIWSGSNSSGKSTLVSQLGLGAVHQGYKVALFSGEMQPKFVKYWLYLQAAGKDQVEPDPLSPNHYKLKEGVKEKLNELMRGKLAIYNNNYGNSWEQVTNIMFAWIKEQNADMVIIDNLMALDFPGTTLEKYETQKKIVTRLSQLAKQMSVHIHFICHPRKTDGFLRKNDICGSSDLANTADNIFMVHRVNNDFLLNIKQVYPKLNIPAEAGNAVEIMKNRDLGVVDEMIMLYFDKTCKTMSDIKGGKPMFSWMEGFTQVSMQDDPDFPF